MPWSKASTEEPGAASEPDLHNRSGFVDVGTRADSDGGDPRPPDSGGRVLDPDSGSLHRQMLSLFWSHSPPVHSDPELAEFPLFVQNAAMDEWQRRQESATDIERARAEASEEIARGRAIRPRSVGSNESQ